MVSFSDIVSWPNRDVTRISLIRSPVQACLMDMTIRSSPFLETIELIDVGARLGEEGRLISLLKLQSETLIFLALKLNHTPEARGLLDTVLAVSGSFPTLGYRGDTEYDGDCRYVQSLKYYKFNTIYYPLDSFLKNYHRTCKYS